jgi:type VI protein secretion system component Hcp
MNVYRVLRRLLVVAASICAFVWVSHSVAQAAITMSCNAPAVGDVTAHGATINHVQLRDFTVENPTIGSSSGGAGAGKAVLQPFTITKTVDTASPSFFKNAANLHTNLGTCTIDFDPGSRPRDQEYLTFTFSNVVISGYKSGSTTETFTLNFTKIIQSNLFKATPTPTPAPTAPALKRK